MPFDRILYAHNYDSRAFFFRELIPAAICHTMLPSCMKNGRPQLSCREDCDEIHRICKKDMDRFYGALEFFIKQNNIDFSHLNVPTCTDLKYSYDYDQSKKETCKFIGLFGEHRVLQCCYCCLEHTIFCSSAIAYL